MGCWDIKILIKNMGKKNTNLVSFFKALKINLQFNRNSIKKIISVIYKIKLR
jgi:hypothetical protein